jgi:hypothetical protein
MTSSSPYNVGPIPVIARADNSKSKVVEGSDIAVELTAFQHKESSGYAH